MLADRFKSKTEKKKKDQTEKDEFEENLESMKTWVRKIEQTTISISSRLAAIERRISNRAQDAALSLLGEGDSGNPGPMQRLFSKLKENRKDKNIEEASRVIDSELSMIEEQLIEQQGELSNIKQQLDNLNATLNDIKKGLEALSNTQSSFNLDISQRVERMEQRAPPVMRIGSKEIPIEITGVIGGLLMFIIAIIVSTGLKDVLISPLFLGLIGFILIGSAVFKTIRFNSNLFNVNLIKGENVVKQIEEDKKD